MNNYFLKTSSFCNNDCIYCEQLNKKNIRDKGLDEIKQEIKEIKGRGFDSIKLSCNTDIRKGFVKILASIKNDNLNIVLETNGRMFCYFDFLKRVDKYIDQYEIYFSSSDSLIYEDMIGSNEGYNQLIDGVKNILKFSKSKKMAIAKIVLSGHNVPFLPSVVDKIKQLGIKQIKFVLPFKSYTNDALLSLPEAVPNIVAIKDYARKIGMEILIDQNLEYNPYLPQDVNFFDTNRARLEINFKKYKRQPRFSIVIPTFNKKDNLKFILHNFFNQDYPKSKYEIIVIDDGSDDKTLQSIRKMKPTCNFKYFYWPRKKIAKFYNRAGPARNIGINNAQGEIILFNDADILVAKSCLKKHDSYHRRYSNIIIRGFRMFLPKEFVPSIKKIENFAFLNKMAKPEKTERGRRLHCRLHDLSIEGWQRIVTSNLSLRKKYLEKVGGFNADFVFWGSEDVDLGYRLSRTFKLKFIWDDKMNVYHLYHPKESGGELSSLLIFWTAANLLYRKYLDEDIYNIVRDVILHRLDDVVIK